MMIRHGSLSLLFLVFFAAIATSVGSTEPPPRPDEGDLFKGQTVNMYFYQNRFFSFSMTIPGDWYPLSSKEFLRLMRRHMRAQLPSDQALRESGQFYLMSISRYQPARRGPQGELNPNIVLLACDLRKLQGIATARDHIEFMKHVMKAMRAQAISDAYRMDLGGTEFWRVDGMVRGRATKYVAYISTVRRGYSLMFQLQAGRKSDMDKLVEVLKSLDFE